MLSRSMRGFFFVLHNFFSKNFHNSFFFTTFALAKNKTVCNTPKVPQGIMLLTCILSINKLTNKWTTITPHRLT